MGCFKTIGEACCLEQGGEHNPTGHAQDIKICQGDISRNVLQFAGLSVLVSQDILEPRLHKVDSHSNSVTECQ